MEKEQPLTREQVLAHIAYWAKQAENPDMMNKESYDPRQKRVSGREAAQTNLRYWKKVLKGMGQ